MSGLLLIGALLVPAVRMQAPRIEAVWENGQAPEGGSGEKPLPATESQRTPRTESRSGQGPRTADLGTRVSTDAGQPEIGVDEPTDLGDRSDDTLIIIGDGDSGDASIIADEPSASAAKPPQSIPASRTWLRAEIASRLMLDIEHDDTGEDVIEWWNAGDLRIDHKVGRDLRAVADTRLRWGVTGEDPASHQPFLLVNARDAKWTGEVELREGWLEARAADLQLRIGQRVFVWGKNEVMAGADVLNPIDLRFDPLVIFESPKDAKVPVFALDARYAIGRTDIQLVILPFFTANRGFLVGRDMALASPGSHLEARIRGIADLHPSVEDQLQSAVFGTRLPEEEPLQSSVALRANTTVASVDLAATAYYGWDRTLRIRVDPDLLLLLEQSDAIQADPGLLLTDPDLRAASLALQRKRVAGEELVRGVYRRMWRLALEGQGVVGDFVLRADVGFSPGQTFYTTTLRPVWKNAMTAALGLETMRGETWYAALTGFGVAIFRAPKGELLIGIEPDDADANERRTAALWGLSATVRWRDPDWDLGAEINGLYDIEPGDRFGTAAVSYSGVEPHVFGIGGMIAEGPGGTIGHHVRRNDFVYVSYRSVW